MKSIIIFSLAVFYSANIFAQNVGIGLLNPARAKLELNGSVGGTTAIFGGDGHGMSFTKDYAGLNFNAYYNGGLKYIANGYGASQWLHQNTGWMAFDIMPAGTANATAVSVARAMTLTPQGRLALSNASPNGDLQFTNALNNRKIVLYESANNDHQYYGFGIQSGTLRYTVDAPGAAHRFYAANSGTSSDLLMTIGGDKKIVIGTQLGTSKVGINSNNPQYSLEIMQTGNTGLVLIDPSTYNNWELKTSAVLPYGNYLFFVYNGTAKSYIKSDGSYTLSDYRLKQNLEPLYSVLENVMQLRPSAYEMKYDNSARRKSIGFIAQDIKNYFPEVVDIMPGAIAGYNDVPDLHAVNYPALTVVSIKAIQEQQHIIESLQLQVNALARKLEDLEKKLTRCSN